MESTPEDAGNPTYTSASTPVRRSAPDATVPQAKARVARILVVEDQDDVRRMLVTALEIEGHDVADAANASDGLRQLQHQQFDLVLSDYAMPGGTGTWMLHEATRRGLMERTTALIVTAHPDVRDFADMLVISKPLDLDLFLEQVRRILSESDDRTQSDPAPQAKTGSPHKVELVLYVSPASAASMQAKLNLERVLGRFDATQVKFTICDLVRDPLAGDNDRIVFTPTLVKHYPEPRMWVLGNLRDPDVLSDLLRVCGVDDKL